MLAFAATFCSAPAVLAHKQVNLEASGAQHAKAAHPAALPLQPPPTTPSSESQHHASTTTGCAIGSSISPGGGSSGSGKGVELAVKPALDQGVLVSDTGSTCGVLALGRPQGRVRLNASWLAQEDVGAASAYLSTGAICKQTQLGCMHCVACQVDTLHQEGNHQDTQTMLLHTARKVVADHHVLCPSNLLACRRP